MTKKQEGISKDIRCRNAREAISASLDHELDEPRMMRLVDHLRGCEPCGEYAGQMELLNSSLKEGLFDQKNPDDLWARVSAAIDAEDEVQAPVLAVNDVTPGHSRRQFMMTGTAAAALLLTIGGFAFYRSKINLQTDVVLETVNDFLTFRASGKKLHVSGNETEKIKNWLTERVSFDIPINAGTPEGFRLVGGRLCSFLNRRLVFMHYEKGEHAASLYVMTEDGLDVPALGAKKIGKRMVFATSLRGMTNVAWRDEGLVYVVVSDLAEAEVFQFVAEI